MKLKSVLHSSALRSMLVALGISVIAASVVVYPPKKSSSIVIGGTQSSGQTTKQGSRTVRTIVGQGPVTNNSLLTPAQQAACAAGQNGGATDVGVTSNEIKLGATVVNSGVGASFLADARYGMQGVVDAVNRAGGICGRQIKLVLKDDGWDFQKGGDDLRSLVEDDHVFALAVVPSSEGLKNISDSGYLRRNGIPVVGTDGMLIHQYRDPFIWPVAASTVSAMHIMAKQAYDAGARRFGIVYEDTYHFGIEGAYAFNAEVKRLTGHDVDGYSNPLTSPRCDQAFCGIADSQPSYGTETQTFNNACENPRCDFVALLLEPSTALSWLTGGAITPSDNFRMGGPQPLFTRSFAQSCGPKCNGLWLWTGFDPPLAGNLGKPAMQQYLNEVGQASSSADTNNTFVEGSYVGMSMMVHALQAVGPNLTRANLVSVLNNFSFDPGLTTPLTWTQGSHFANTRMQAWSIQYKDRFSGWRDEQTVMNDDEATLDVP
ncbi:MAG: ABC transporter substrate-binding protein [Actinomycetota bacterium]